MKNTTIIVMIIMLVLVGGWFTFVNGKNVNSTNIISDEKQIVNNKMQKIVLSQSGYNYKDINAKSGEPIEISADDSVRGCLRSAVFNVNGKKYSKYLRTAQDTLQLPALSKGTYAFSCSMGMGFGKLIVK